MDLWKIIFETYPELKDIVTPFGPVVLQDDSDDNGPYIAKWEYSKPLPSDMKVGK